MENQRLGVAGGVIFYVTRSVVEYVKLKTKIENSSTFESDPDFVKTLIQNCIDERVSRNKREVTSGKQKIELAKLQLAQLEKKSNFKGLKIKALSLNPAAKFEEKQFKTLNKETATHIGIREAEDWFRPIDLAKECDIYISSRSGSHKEIPITYGYTQDPFKNKSQNFKTKIKENYPQYHEKKIKIALYAAIHLIAQETLKCWNGNITDLDRRIYYTLYSEIEKLGHAKSDVSLSESGSSLSADCGVSFPNVSVSNVIENSSYDLPYVKNFNTRNDSSSLIKDYKYSPLVSMEIPLRTAYGQNGRCGMQPKPSSLRAQAQQTKTKTFGH
ncbi:hypothetical protein TNCV_2929011 [Trichonephila clavipes]|nr:hypothetical protein TNCV_2929011 [Trichonephila clavipes]